MRKLISKHALVAIAAGGMLFSSCGDHDMFNPNYKKNEYAANWETKFGKIDPAQDWSMATQKTVNITVDGTKTVQILTGNPYLNEGQLAGEFTVTTQLSAKVDLRKGSNVIYVVQRNEDGTKDVRTTNINEDGTFDVNFSKSAARAHARVVTRSGSRSCTEISTVVRSTPYASGLYYYSDQWGTYSCLWDEAPKKYNNWGDKYYYVGDNAYGKATVDVSVLGAIKEIVPENQKSSYYNTIIKDVDLVVKEDGPVTLTLVNATTSNNAAIGYYIYTDKKVDNTDMSCPEWLTGEWLQNNGYDAGYKTYTVETRAGITDAQKLADKFVIIPNVKDYSLNPTENYAPATAENGWNGRITESYNCKTITLLYRDPATGETSETFPAGTKIAFFIVPNANCNGNNYIDAQRTVFSFADMNVDAHRTNVDNSYYKDFSHDTYSSSHAATFKVQDKIVIGFEDANAYASNDFDYNDCIFLLDGNFDEEIIPDPIPEEKTESQSWILACEDLGSTDDYDFNDIVLEIRHEITYDNDTHDFISSEIQVRCLAAGGTIPANIYYGDNRVGEAHEMLGGQTNQMINTTSYGKPSDWYTVATGVTEDRNILTIDEIINKISIRVTQNEGDAYATEIKAPEIGEAPQMIIVPGDWEWPAERKGIETAYPDFTNWSSNASLTDWNSVKVSDKVVKR